jgi:hypothetical protein
MNGIQPIRKMNNSKLVIIASSFEQTIPCTVINIFHIKLYDCKASGR